MNTASAKPARVEDVMTKDIVVVRPETSLAEAAQLLTKHNFSGLPVVSKDGKLAGLVTEYDLIEKGTAMHLPTLAKLLSDFSFYKSDKDFVLPEVKKMLSLRVEDVMNREPLTLPENATVEEAIEVFAHHHAVNPVPVIDVQKRLVGILARFDIIKLFHTVPHPSSAEVSHERTHEDPQIQAFLTNLEDRFIVVPKARARYWLLASILFAIVGFIIAFALILRLAA
jgi:CBS domain-containing protein